MIAQASFQFETPAPELPKTVDGRGPEVVPHPLGGYTHAIPVPGTTCRPYDGQWMLKRRAQAMFFQRYPQLAPRPRISKARQSSVPLPLPVS
jgi:hypothetical protein